MAHMSNIKEEQQSEEEVFFGELSLKEIKKHILWHNNHRKYQDTFGSDFKLIETHSAPDLIQKVEVQANNNLKHNSCTSLSPPGPEVYSEWEVKPVDDSFLKVEQFVDDLSVSPKKVPNKELNNTLDIVDYILKNGAPDSSSNDHTDKSNSIAEVKSKMPNLKVTQCESPRKDQQLASEQNIVISSPAYLTPAKSAGASQKMNQFVTPSPHLKQKSTVFKTPANPLSDKKSTTSLKKTPMKNNAYQHIASPVASYIKNCPVAPLVKDIRPTKPLPGPSSIPIFMKTPALNKVSNKENANLPSVAYKSAKKTQVIHVVPDEQKLPQTQLMKKITSSLPKPLILKHNHREMNLAKRVLGARQEDSFADLSLQQADVSVCTQKSAFNKPRKVL